MRQQIRLKESELQNIIEESVRRVIAENMEDEFNLRGKYNQVQSAGHTLFNKESGDWKERLKKARKNWTSQGELNDINSLIQQLTQLIDARKIDPQITVGQLVGGKYNNNRFGKMTAIAANRRGQILGRGGTAY